MSDEVLTQMISSYLKTEQPVHTFMWQGGEPTLMGVDFFRRVNELQIRFARHDASILNAIQTNGVLVDDELAEHFAQHKYLCGISLDGPVELHDRERMTPDCKGSHASVMRGIDTLKRHQVDLNVLTLVNQSNVHHAVDVYEFLKETGFIYQQYIPCIDLDASGRPRPYAIDGPSWGAFLCTLFDRWYKNDLGKISIQMFELILQRLIDGTQNLCIFGDKCNHYLVVEYNGDIYPCDFYVYPEWKLGSIFSQSWEEMSGSSKYAQFAVRKSKLHQQCISCPFILLCGGGCPRERPEANNVSSKSALCEGWRIFFNHALPRLSDMAKQIRHRLIQERRIAAR